MEQKKSKYFILKKEYLNKGFTIVVNQGFKYNHDDLFNNQKHRFLKGGSAFKSWSTKGVYTKTIGYPSWANEFITTAPFIKPSTLSQEADDENRKSNDFLLISHEGRIKKIEKDLTRLRLATIILLVSIVYILYRFSCNTAC